MPKFTDTEPDLTSIPTDEELENLPLSQLRDMRKTFKLKMGDKKQQIILALSQLRIPKTQEPEPESFAQLVARDFPIPQVRFDYYDPPSIATNNRESSPPVTYNHGSSPARRPLSAPSGGEDRASNPTGKRQQQVYKTVRQIRLTAHEGRPLISARVVKKLCGSSALVAIRPPPAVYYDPYDTDTQITPPPMPPLVKREPLGCITKQFLQVEDIEYEEVENAEPSSHLLITDPLCKNDIIAEERMKLKPGLEGEDDHKDEVPDSNQDKIPYSEEWEDYTDEEENDENIPPSAQCKFVPCRKEFLVQVNLSDVERLRSERPSSQKTIGLLAGLMKE